MVYHISYLERIDTAYNNIDKMKYMKKVNMMMSKKTILHIINCLYSIEKNSNFKFRGDDVFLIIY